MSEWNIAIHDKDKVEKITENFKINKLTAKLLINRGYETKEKIEVFLNKSKDLLHDPLLMSDMEKGIKRVNKAFLDKEKVMIYGDYDVDGISSVCLMYTYLKNLGIEVYYYIPDRFEEGYGINNDAINKAFEKNIDLIITVDTGITAANETRYAKEMGIDIVITDHHECPKILPEAAAIVNPKKQDCPYPFKELAGVGVAFKFISAYDLKYENNNKINFKFEDYCEFVAMGTVADIMSLTGENRVMVDIGLKKMKNSNNLGINAILESYFKYKEKKNVSTDIISFYISPRINAAGRLAKADMAVNLFLTKNKNEAEIIAEELSVLNKKRQETEKEIFIQAENQLNEIEEKEKKKIIILHADNWNQGVIGIVASKLSEKYNKAFILFAKDSGEIYKGSCRSVKNINIIELLTMCSDILIKYGGHERAAGLSAKYENIKKLDRKLNNYINKNDIEIEDDKIYNIECEIKADNITFDIIREFEILEPFGNDNPVPLFAVIGCKIMNITQIGENKHIRIDFNQNNIFFEAVYFNMDPDKFIFNKNDIIDLVCNININEFMNKKKVQYIIRDMRLNKDFHREYYFEKENYINFLKNSGGIKINNEDIPERDDFKYLYIFLLSLFEKETMYEYEYNINKLQNKYFEFSHKHYSRLKFRIILDIFKETDIIYIDHDFENIKKIKINNKLDKINLYNSEIYKKLMELRE